MNERIKVKLTRGLTYTIYAFIVCTVLITWGAGMILIVEVLDLWALPIIIILGAFLIGWIDPPEDEWGFH